MNTQIIKQYVIHEFLPDVDAGELDNDYNLLEGGVIDSLAVLKVLTWLERQFEISMDDIDISPTDFQSITAMASFVERATTGR
ncbi:acyl carrier protein [Saccharothrix ecbatanensis]|jgi:acyl carrier protein|uniref:Acyl carrier protein n=1 Tax=Saccharothrix ecbatanensis TaxID=1105145 RepID=A0A7W9HHU7_9PSEU|nr:phosphopantetheine-binding protein [Saccharothrix ecbatanensis]MBB5802221.1 acyl carrier protein [Saccharothrix ecbatanensis]